MDQYFQRPGRRWTTQVRLQVVSRRSEIFAPQKKDSKAISPLCLSSLLSPETPPIIKNNQRPWQILLVKKFLFSAWLISFSGLAPELSVSTLQVALRAPVASHPYAPGCAPTGCLSLSAPRRLQG